MRPDDVLYLGSCDNGVYKLAQALGWVEEIEKYIGKTFVPLPEDGVGEDLKSVVVESEELLKDTARTPEPLNITTGHSANIDKIAAAIGYKQKEAEAEPKE
jgi:NAD-dependent histone deacetylase SIR2